MKRWFVVIGREAFEEEDRAAAFHAGSLEEACQMFREHVQEEVEDKDAEIYVNLAIECGDCKPEIHYPYC